MKTHDVMEEDSPESRLQHAGRQFIDLTRDINQQGRDLSPAEKTQILRRVINCLNSYISIQHLGVISLKELLEQRYTSIGFNNEPVEIINQIPQQTRVIRLHESSDPDRSRLSSEEIVTVDLVVDTHGNIIVIQQHFNLDGVFLIRKKVMVFFETEQIGYIDRLMSDQPILFYKCLARLLDTISEAISRAERRVQACRQAFHAMKILQDMELDNDFLSAIIVHMNSRNMGDIHSNTESAEKITSFATLCRRAGSTRKERIDRFLKALTELQLPPKNAGKILTISRISRLSVPITDSLLSDPEKYSR